MFGYPMASPLAMVHLPNLVLMISFVNIIFLWNVGIWDCCYVLAKGSADHPTVDGALQMLESYSLS